MMADVRIDFDPEQTATYDFYRLLTAVVVPRPIAWVSTVSPDGVDNLAPHSFFTVACLAPPIVEFVSVGRKDSLRNAEATGDFVVSLTPESMFEQVNATSTDFPAHVSEFDAVGIEREPSLRVKSARVAGSPVAIECVFHGTMSFGDSTMVFGRVVHLAIDEQAVDSGHPEVSRLAPLSRLGKDEWGTTDGVREITRIPFKTWPGHYASDDQEG
jgi:flavin reductase (DIM6/NTAB) family NADH-FMN oxidoreductase RutF